MSSGLSPIFNSARRTWIAAYQSNEAGLLPHTLWQSTNGTAGANITNWAGCGRIDTSIFHGALSDLAALGWGGTVTPPPPPPFHGEWVTAGQMSLNDLAASFGLTSASLLRMTAVHYGSFNPQLAVYVNGVHAGTTPPTASIPAGAKVWVN